MSYVISIANEKGGVAKQPQLSPLAELWWRWESEY